MLKVIAGLGVNYGGTPSQHSPQHPHLGTGVTGQPCTGTAPAEKPSEELHIAFHLVLSYVPVYSKKIPNMSHTDA